MGNDQSTLHHNRYFTNSGYKNRKSESQILSGSKVACSTTNSLNVSNHTIVDKSSLSYRGSNSKITTRRVSATTDTSPTLVNKKKESPISLTMGNTSTVLLATPTVSPFTPELDHTPTPFRLVINQLRQACKLPPSLGPSPRKSP